jgi:hypothetical protein
MDFLSRVARTMRMRDMVSHVTTGRSGSEQSAKLGLIEVSITFRTPPHRKGPAGAGP